MQRVALTLTLKLTLTLTNLQIDSYPVAFYHVAALLKKTVGRYQGAVLWNKQQGPKEDGHQAAAGRADQSAFPAAEIWNFGNLESCQSSILEEINEHKLLNFQSWTWDNIHWMDGMAVKMSFKLRIPTNLNTNREGNKNIMLLAKNITPTQNQRSLLDKGLSFIPTVYIHKKNKKRPQRRGPGNSNCQPSLRDRKPHNKHPKCQNPTGNQEPATFRLIPEKSYKSSRTVKP